MKFINPSVSTITEKDPFKKIERVGRTCYKSEGKITEGSARKFYQGLVNRKHTAMVEHATFVFQVDTTTYFRLYGSKFLNYTYNSIQNRFLISGNLRALNESKEFLLLNALHLIDPQLVYEEYPDSIECGWIPSIVPVNIEELEGLSEDEFMNHFYMTFHYITDRGVTHEMVRHRPASYAQESTRYCNYVKAQFGGELTFIKPAHWDSLPDYLKSSYVKAWDKSEEEYMWLISHGQTPQQARAVLSNALKTEIIMTACAGELEHYFDLRSRGVTGAPHPDIKVVADMALALYEVERMKLLGV